MSIDRNTWRAGLRAAGGADALAEKLGIKRRTIFVWRLRGFPAERLAEVAHLTGIPAAELRPDIAEAFAAAKR